MGNKRKDVIEIPAEVLAAATTLDDVENWLIAHDPGSLRALERAREQHARGELLTLEEVERHLATTAPTSSSS